MPAASNAARMSYTFSVVRDEPAALRSASAKHARYSNEMVAHLCSAMRASRDTDIPSGRAPSMIRFTCPAARLRALTELDGAFGAGGFAAVVIHVPLMSEGEARSDEETSMPPSPSTGKGEEVAADGMTGAALIIQIYFFFKTYLS